MSLPDKILQDQLIEIRTLDDPAWGDAAGWPAWTDEDRWELGPVPEDRPDMLVIGAELPGPTDADWDEYARWSEWQDRLEGVYGLNRLTDEDVPAGGLVAG